MFVSNSMKGHKFKWTLVKAWVQFIEESCIYLFILSYSATPELRPQFRRTTAPFYNKLKFYSIQSNHCCILSVIVSSCLLMSPLVSSCLTSSPLISSCLLMSPHVSSSLLIRSTVDHADHFL